MLVASEHAIEVAQQLHRVARAIERDPQALTQFVVNSSVIIDAHSVRIQLTVHATVPVQ